MAAYFLDSSAAVKLSVREVGTSWLLALVDPATGHELAIARVTPVEIAAALFRRVRGRSLPAAQAKQAMAALRRSVQGTFQTVELLPPVADLAMDLAERHGLRGYDCVQLASALTAHRARVGAGLGPLTLISADAELNAAAMAEGLAVDDPRNHPP